MNQGVRQGGVTSAPIYKVYIIRLSEPIGDHHINHCIGSVKVPAPTCADDMAILSNSQIDTQLALNIVDNYAINHRYKINASKSAVIPYHSAVHTTLTVNDEEMPYCDEAVHLGISRKISDSFDVEGRIRCVMRTVYALMGAGLHGRNGIPPHKAFHIWSTYVLPRMLYGIDATSFKHVKLSDVE